MQRRPEENKQIETIFTRIRDISQAYIDGHYPEAPDQDVFIGMIATELDNYNMLGEANAKTDSQ